MKNIKIIATTFSLVIICFSIVLFSSCEKKAVSYNSTTNVRPCDNVICLNGGACSDGLCYCPVGYEGTKCETKWSDKFVGNFQAQDDCYTGSTAYYSVSITADIDFANKIKIFNLGTSCANSTIFATITPEKTTFDIPMQNTCGNIYYNGTGNISNQEINVYIVARDSVAHTSKPCSILLHKL